MSEAKPSAFCRWPDGRVLRVDLDEAVDRIRDAYHKAGVICHPGDEDLRAAIIGPDPYEPLAWERETAREWVDDVWPLGLTKDEYAALRPSESRA